MQDVVLPPFQMDCRDWLVVHAGTPGLPDEVGGAPLVAVLSTVVISGDQFCEGSGVITVGLLDDETLGTRPLGETSVAAELIERSPVGKPAEPTEPTRAGEMHRYVLPAPEGQLALLAEFRLGERARAELLARIESLLVSFRWVDLAA